MNKNILFPILALCTVIGMSSCTDPKQKLVNEIEEIQAVEVQTGETKAKLAELQESYVMQFPDDSISETYLENAAMYFQLTQKNEKAIALAHLHLERYPKSENAITMTSNIAKSYADLNKYDSAIAYFEKAQTIGNTPIGDLRVWGSMLDKMLRDPNTPDKDECLMKYAGILEQTEGPSSSIEQYQRLYGEYSDSKYAPYALMKHETLMEGMGEIDSARALLEMLIERYPESKFANDAKSMIENDLLGKTPEEQLEILLNKNEAMQ